MQLQTEEELKLSVWRNTFRTLRHRNFRLYWSSQIISQTGSWMQVVAQSWIVYELTKSPFLLGLVNFIGLIPTLPVSLIAGVVIDRYSRRKVLIVTETILTLQAFAMAALVWFHVIQVWHIILLTCILGAAMALEQPARLAFIVDVVGKDDLTNATALNSSVFNAARIIGPSIAGLTLAWVGASWCFLINAISFIPVVLAILVMDPIIETHRRDLQSKTKGMVSAGLKYILKNQVIFALMTIVIISSTFTMSFVALTTVFSDEVLKSGSSGFGLLMGAVGVGAVIGALIVANIRAGHRGRWLNFGNILVPAVLIFFSFSRVFPLSLVLIAVVAASSSIRQTLVTSLIQINTPNEYQGRVMSLFNLLYNGMARVGVMGIGGLAEFTGIAVAVAIGGIISLVWGAVVIWRMPYVDRLS